jgi:hypothetical protein
VANDVPGVLPLPVVLFHGVRKYRLAVDPTSEALVIQTLINGAWVDRVAINSTGATVVL